MNQTKIFHAQSGRILADPERESFIESFASLDERVIAVGRFSDLRDRFPEAGTVALGGALVLPGLCDAHVHLMFTIAQAQALNFKNDISIHEILNRLTEFSTSIPAKTRILGFGFGATAIAGAESFPSGSGRLTEAISKAAGGRSVFLISNDAHTAITSESLRGGKPGVLRESVFTDYDAFWPPAERAVALDPAIAGRIFHSEGITSVHNFEGPGEHADLTMAAERGILQLRVFSYFTHQGGPLTSSLPRPRPVCPSHEKDGHRGMAEKTRQGFGLVTAAGIKIFADGSLSSHTAAMDEPYLDGSGSRGMLRMERHKVEILAGKAMDLGFPLAVHAIGDRAFREVLLGLTSAKAGKVRHRIEHAQTIPADLEELSTLSKHWNPNLPPVSVQPVHMPLDFTAAKDLLGDRFRFCYALGSLNRSGFRLMISSDSPVARPDTAAAFELAVGRRTPMGPWTPGESITPIDAIRAMTVWPADSVGARGEVGIIAPGSRADFVVLQNDLLDPEQQNWESPGNPRDLVCQTWFGGKLVYERQANRVRQLNRS